MIRRLLHVQLYTAECVPIEAASLRDVILVRILRPHVTDHVKNSLIGFSHQHCCSGSNCVRVRMAWSKQSVVMVVVSTDLTNNVKYVQSANAHRANSE